jgi:A/G-specific adenine glycosylase
MDTDTFQKKILDYYIEKGRHDLPWRRERTPFTAFLSEVMLQQTQVLRVVDKFEAFRRRFSSFADLAHAPQGDIIRLWQGLGYNRRALFLHRAAQKIVVEHGGQLPENSEDLLSLPGIGPATAASLQVYAFNHPVVFIETNIRAVYIFHFFSDKTSVTDAEIRPLVEETLDYSDPYSWYSALMDYGVMIKRNYPNPSRKSRHHVKQSVFAGSRRQVRGRILTLLSTTGKMSRKHLVSTVDDHRAASVIEELVSEGFLRECSQGVELG